MAGIDIGRFEALPKQHMSRKRPVDAECVLSFTKDYRHNVSNAILSIGHGTAETLRGSLGETYEARLDAKTGDMLLVPDEDGIKLGRQDASRSKRAQIRMPKDALPALTATFDIAGIAMFDVTVTDGVALLTRRK